MQTHIKVRGYHMDVYQHVNNARYLEFLEEARWEGLEKTTGFQWMTEHNIAFHRGEHQYQLSPPGGAWRPASH
ncbi:Long-chain acyl-CoA thioesterase FadM [Cedecea neteri]|uniref:Long-chain acyl-CoA thioesterase FadM n=1 Tax=Cedecea neteri TaxID=158822 RepID=A0A2X2V5V2_9ENTR|nr:Long-chain acyl-CoA thioesterase FadM [Cedecea neteri]